MLTAVVDLDGTLFDSRHREHFARNKEWDEFHKASIRDEPFADVAAFITMVNDSGGRIIGLTGRTDNYRPLTIDHLVKFDIPIDELLMRSANDFRPDTIVKPELLSNLFGGMDVALEKVDVILEDRDAVVAKWRELGFRCWQVAPGGY